MVLLAEAEGTICTSNPCSSEKHHPFGSTECQCQITEACNPPTMECTTNGIITIYGCEDSGAGGGGGSGSSGNETGGNNDGGDSSTNGGGGGTSSEEEEDGVVVIPLEEPTRLTEEDEMCILSLGASLNLSTEQIDCLTSGDSGDVCELNTDVSNFLSNPTLNNYTEEAALVLAQEFMEIRCSLPEAKLDRFLQLMDRLDEDPFALVRSCVEQSGLNTQNYLDLYNKPFPQECTDRLNNSIGVGPHQPITDGNVPCANIDYYSVEVTSNPDFNGDGLPDSPTQMYQAFRNKFTELASGENNSFQFSCDTNFDGEIDSDDTGSISWEFIPVTAQDGEDFVSNDPIASILLIEANASGIGALAADDGAIIVTDYTPNNWTIATIYTDTNGSQPFSGNRQWGWNINENGNFEFFTRAVDVANISKLLNVWPSPANTECQQDTYYNVGAATWENLQDEILEWVSSVENQGQANINNTVARRVPREKIVEILTSNENIDNILNNCN